MSMVVPPRKDAPMADHPSPAPWHGTTILSVRRGDTVVIAGDGQVSMGQTIVKGSARKVRPLAGGSVIAGFAGATADALTLFERLENKLERFPGQLTRAAVEMAKEKDYMRSWEVVTTEEENTMVEDTNHMQILQ